MRPGAVTASLVPLPLVIVAKNRPSIYEDAKRLALGYAGTTVVVDRRCRSRRQVPAAAAHERRRTDRRQRPDLDDQLRLRGWVLVPLSACITATALAGPPQREGVLPLLPTTPQAHVPCHLMTPEGAAFKAAFAAVKRQPPAPKPADDPGSPPSRRSRRRPKSWSA